MASVLPTIIVIRVVISFLREKTYKERIKEWGFGKNNKRARVNNHGDTCIIEGCDYGTEIPELLSDNYCTLTQWYAYHLNGLTLLASQMTESLASTSDASIGYTSPICELIEAQLDNLPLTREGPNTQDLNDMMDHGKSLEDRARYFDAEAMYRKAYVGFEHLLGPKEQTWRVAISIAQACFIQGKSDTSESLLLKVARQVSERPGEADLETLQYLEGFARYLLLKCRFFDGEVVLSRILDAYGFEKIFQPSSEEALDRYRRIILLYADACLGFDQNINTVAKLDRKSRATEMLFRLINIYVSLQVPENPNLSELRMKLRMMYIYQPHLELDQRSISFLLQELREIQALAIPLPLDIASTILELLQTYFQENQRLEELSSLLDHQMSLIQTVVWGLEAESLTCVTLKKCTAKSFYLLQRYGESNPYYQGGQDMMVAGREALDDLDASSLWPISNPG